MTLLNLVIYVCVFSIANILCYTVYDVSTYMLAYISLLYIANDVAFLQFS